MTTAVSQQQLRHRRNSGDSPKAHRMEEIEVTPLLSEADKTTKGSATKKEDDADGYLLIPLRERPILTRLDFGPFLLCYSLLFFLDYADLPEQYQDMMIYHWFSQLAFPFVLLGHITLFLLQQWDVFWRASVGYKRMPMSSMDRWTHCLVEAPHVDKHQSSHDAGIVSVNIKKDDVAIVNFQDVIFHCSRKEDVDATLWSESSSDDIPPSSPLLDTQQPVLSFHRLRYPIDLPLSFYRQWNGHTAIPKVVEAQQVYGTNTTPIELPPFLQLLQEQVVAPFFIFQVLCVLLWSLDEYWYYALFTFFAILMFESTVAYNRLHSLQRLRSHTDTHQQRPIWVYRPSYPPGMTGWIRISVAEIVPGDVVSCKQVTPTRARQETEQQLNRVPADILILNGDAVVDEAMLTGESVPQLKVALEDSPTGLLDLQEHKQFILFGGTTLIVSHSDASGTTEIPPAPDQGVVGMVLRTGFETAQGSLLRTLAHTQKSVDGIHTRDTYVFILLLLCCAVASASMVWTEGWKDPTRNKFRLVLHVIIIITSVVPPELPMELSLAVTNSVADLMKRCRIYCTEVFRIPLAGQVNFCCFDKTGTLTSDEMLLKGIRYVNEKTVELSDVVEPGDSLPWTVARTMVACHSLALSGNNGRGKDAMANVIGDPLEKAVLKDTGYRVIQNNALRAMESTPGRPSTLLILKRFGFTSQLKRMTVLVREDSSSTTWALTKGAPETIKQFLKPEAIPSNYDEIYMHHMSLGQRVLAMAYRELKSEETSGSLKEVQRELIECNLTFAGFLLLHCPVKPDSSSVISELQMSGHTVVMITGDAILTAAEVARQVGIVQKCGSSFPPVYQLQQREKGSKADDLLSGFSFVPLVEDSTRNGAAPDELPLTRPGIQDVQKMVSDKSIALCVSGDALQKLVLSIVRREESSVLGSCAPMKKDEKQVLFHPAAQAFLKELVPFVSVFARHAPRQKEAIIAALNLGGYNTLMCGDGTNDVGALRRAHVGISIISAPEVEAKQRSATEAISRAKAQQKKERKERKKKGPGGSDPSRLKSSSALQESLRQLQEAQEELDHVELGDASIASPFTSRTASIKCCKDVLQTGRCTQVTMLQIYKILGVNCLVNAMVLSKLFLHGVKQGDRQLTILGMAVAALFLFVTRGKPLPSLSPTRPPSSVLCIQALLSIVLQFGLHFGAILLVTEVALSFVDPYDPSMIPDGPFNPNTLNTCTFLMSALATVNTFAVNYRGEPFMEPLKKNKMLLRSLQLCYGVLLVCALEVFPPLNDLFQLTEFPVTTADEISSWRVEGPETGFILSTLTKLVKDIGFPTFICSLMILDTVLAFAIESAILRMLEPSQS